MVGGKGKLRFGFNCRRAIGVCPHGTDGGKRIDRVKIEFPASQRRKMVGKTRGDGREKRFAHGKFDLEVDSSRGNDVKPQGNDREADAGLVAHGDTNEDKIRRQEKPPEYLVLGSAKIARLEPDSRACFQVPAGPST